MSRALGPGRCHLVTGAWSWTAVAATLGMFDVEFEILGPPELVEAALTLATRCSRAAGPGRAITPGG
jgi:hypothetical protein